MSPAGWAPNRAPWPAARGGRDAPPLPGAHADADGRFGVWAIEVRDTGVLVGSVLFKPAADSDASPTRDVEVGWHLHPDSWGHGYATEAARSAMDRAFAAAVTEIYAVVYPGNERSVRGDPPPRHAAARPPDRWYGGITLNAFVATNPTPTTARAPAEPPRP